LKENSIFANVITNRAMTQKSKTIKVNCSGAKSNFTPEEINAYVEVLTECINKNILRDIIIANFKKELTDLCKKHWEEIMDAMQEHVMKVFAIGYDEINPTELLNKYKNEYDELFKKGREIAKENPDRYKTQNSLNDEVLIEFCKGLIKKTED
jgi:hypothetical protein